MTKILPMPGEPERANHNDAPTKGEQAMTSPQYYRLRCMGLR